MKTTKTVFTVIKEGEVLDTFGSIKNLAASLSINPNILYHRFSRKKQTEVEVASVKIYKTQLV